MNHDFNMSGGDFDPVNKPEHYASQGVECIDVILQNCRDLPGDQAALYANIQKYIWRYNSKGDPVRDLRKAKWYLDRLLDVVLAGACSPDESFSPYN
jgi:hypothetical protein